MAASRHTVLVIDDEPDVVKSVHDLLRLEYRVLTATSGREAMDILHRDEVHVIMSDQRMPGMTGVEFLHRARGEYPDAIRIIFTGYADLQAVVEAINQGNVFRYVVKPWDPAELQGVIRDACERYDLLVERRRLLGELQDKNRELESANADLRQADELKHNFVQVASHELRTPLSIVLMLSRMALQNAPLGTPTIPGTDGSSGGNGGNGDSGGGGHDPRLRAYLERIERAGRRLEYLVKQMDMVLSARRFTYNLNRSVMDLGALLEAAAEEVRPFIALRHQELTVDVPADLGTINVDCMKIQDSVAQLLMNAVKFTADGGRITLSARRLPGAGAEIGSEAKSGGGGGGGGAEVRVSDTGVGIEPQYLPHVFDPLFTGSDPLHHSSGVFEFGRKGLGLGLFAVKAFVEMHGGTIRVESHINRGTTFTLTLPDHVEALAVAGAPEI